MISVTRTFPESSYDRVSTYTGTSANAFNAWQGFSCPVEEVKLTAKDEGCIFQFSANGVIPTGDIHVETDMLITMPLRCWYWRVKSMVTDQHSKYKLEAYWNYF